MVIVAWNSADDLARTLPALAPELGPDDEVIIVDNGSSDDPSGVATRTLASVRMILMGRNAGYAAAVNRGAADARGDLLVILNPDAKPEPGFGEAIRRPVTDGCGWAAWMALVLCEEDGRRVVNSAGNPIHFTGFAWAGSHGLPVDEPAPSGEVPTMSGACLAIPRAGWRRVGGFPDRFFLYQEDTDLSVRLRLAGGTIGLVGDAVVDHDYDPAFRSRKFFWLERNRLAMIVRTYPAALLLPVAPVLMLTEVAILAAASRGGWLRSKLAADFAFLRWLPRLLRERRRIQASRRISADRLAGIMTADLDSPYFPAFVSTGPVRLLLRSYWGLVRLLLRLSGRSGGSGSR